MQGKHLICGIILLVSIASATVGATQIQGFEKVSPTSSGDETLPMPPIFENTKPLPPATGVDPGPGVIAVPEPGTISMLLLGLSGLSGVAWIRRSRRS